MAALRPRTPGNVTRRGQPRRDAPTLEVPRLTLLVVVPAISPLILPRVLGAIRATHVVAQMTLVVDKLTPIGTANRTPGVALSTQTRTIVTGAAPPIASAAPLIFATARLIAPLVTLVTMTASPIFLIATAVTLNKVTSPTAHLTMAPTAATPPTGISTPTGMSAGPIRDLIRAIATSKATATLAPIPGPSRALVVIVSILAAAPNAVMALLMRLLPTK